jgi:SAM-dependent methyltransferase
LATDEAFDIIVSFFVWEHLARPAQCLDKMCSLLRRDGRLIIVSPKYTFPLYIPPAIRHLSRSRQLRANARLVVDSLLTGIRRRPRFSVVIDPAVFHAPWRRDFDAIHMVSSADLTAHLGRAWRVGNLPVEYGSLKARLLASLMLLSVVICRR